MQMLLVTAETCHITRTAFPLRRLQDCMGVGMFTSVKSDIDYGKCSSISNTLLFFFTNKMVAISAGIANRVDPDQTASPEAV